MNNDDPSLMLAPGPQQQNPALPLQSPEASSASDVSKDLTFKAKDKLGQGPDTQGQWPGQGPDTQGQKQGQALISLSPATMGHWGRFSPGLIATSPVRRPYRLYG